jgi:uncharacterized membrane protein (UPF0182 family)
MSQQSVKKPRKALSPARISIIIIIAIGLALVSSAGFYTDVLWFEQLGYSSVFFTEIWAKVAMFAITALFMALLVGVSMWLAFRSRPIYAKSANARDVFAPFRDTINQLRLGVIIGVPLLLGIFAGLAATAKWDEALMFINAVPTPTHDAQFNLDVSFYLFKLPFYSTATAFISTVLFLSALSAALVHLFTGGIKFNGRGVTLSKAAGVQVGITAALFMLAQGISLWLDQYATLTSPSGLYTGATFADVNASIPGLQIMAGIAVLVAILFVISAFIGRWRLPVLGTGLMLVSSLVLGSLYPWAIQNFQVGPNERTLEAPFIQRNIEATTLAYGLDNIETISYDAKTTASAGALRKDADTTANIRIIDPYLVSPSFRQLEQIKQYYGFSNHLDVSRYTIDGKVQDTVLAVRELNQGGLGDSQSWYNNVIVYTHGYGLVAAYGNQGSADGQPVFLQSSIPSEGSLGTFEPRIYFGEQSPGYSIVGAEAGATQRELDYPGGAKGVDQTYTTFKGNGGPKLDNIVKRLSYALKFQSEQILLSDAINNSSQILYDRNPIDRVKAVAPYLTIDSDTYPAVVDGKVVWVVDGYTTSNQYPYSRAESFDQSILDSSGESTTGNPDINYIRNSVKATVDAYDGSVKLYAWDEADPILKVWQKIFPNTLRPISEMSGALMSQVRYPADLFKVQRSILGQYHVKEAGAFYSQQDAWMTPNDPISATGLQQPPYYLTMKAPGAKDPAYSLYSTFIPRSTGESTRNVLTGYLMVNSDAGAEAGKVSSSYGKFKLLTLPRTTIVPGPGQVQNSFSVDPDVSRLLNLLRQGSTKVLNGNLLTLPVGGGLLYVQPVYIQSTGETSFPLLKKILVAFGDQIAFEDTLDGALNVLFGGDSGVVTPDPGTDPGPTDPGNANPAVAKALAAAKQAFADKIAAMKSGDWTAYGEADKALKAALDAAIAANK